MSLIAWMVLVVVPLVAVVAVSVALVVRFRHPPRRLRRMRAESGWGDWRQAASTLRWRDRWRLRRANAAGRAVADVRLAPHAVRRAEALRRLHLWVLLHGAVPRWLRLASIVVWLLLAVTNLIGWLLDGWWGQLVLVVGGVAVALMWAFFDRIQARSSKRAIVRAQRSAEANRRLTDSLTGR